jgi:gamma-glutamylcyclotransferase (GGCT)/AIG2-like uncharacterized protein YtfP
MDLLFVYGSLRSEFDNVYARQLRAEGEFLASGTVAGSLWLVSWYPGFRREGEGRVTGEVYRVNATTLAALDGYEGEEYRRVQIEVEGVGMAWIYEYVPEVAGMARIETGDYINR